MLVRLKYWWARRCALNALCISLEETPERWTFIGDEHAELNEVRITCGKNYSKMFFPRYANVYHKDGGYFQPPFRYSRRLLRAMRKAHSYTALKGIVKSLKPTNTPLQIEDAKSS
jgi:hypothetical protein